MKGFKEFQGKDLDSAIGEACEYYNLPREQLEIEIVQDAKAGIFGLVGVRKAKIRARKTYLKETVEHILGKKNPVEVEQLPLVAQEETQEELADVEEIEEDANVRNIPLEQLDHNKLFTLLEQTLRTLVRPVIGETVSIDLQINNGHIEVHLDCEEDCVGLLIGREGQTLLALQYLTARIVSKQMSAVIKIQLDICKYRNRQEEKLKEIALSMAERVRQTGRPCSTRPLSSYHRRIVHLCLQNVADIQTRSIGNDNLKRVVIMKRRSEKSLQTQRTAH